MTDKDKESDISWRNKGLPPDIRENKDWRKKGLKPRIIDDSYLPDEEE